MLNNLTLGGKWVIFRETQGIGKQSKEAEEVATAKEFALFPEDSGKPLKKFKQSQSYRQHYLQRPGLDSCSRSSWFRDASHPTPDPVGVAFTQTPPSNPACSPTYRTRLVVAILLARFSAGSRQSARPLPPCPAPSGPAPPPNA